MKMKIFTFVLPCIFFFFFILMFIYSKDISDTVIFSISLWKDNLLPSLFPFLLITQLLIEYGFIEIISFFFGKYMNVFFNLPNESSYAFITSLFSGFPSGSKYVIDLLEHNLISEKDANHLIMFTHYANPIFITSTIGIFLLQNQKYSYIILLSHIVSNILVALLFKEKKKRTYKKKKFNEVLKGIYNKKHKSFIFILTKAILESFKLLISMLGIITFFLIIATLIDKILNPNTFFKILISSFLEMTQGIKNVSQLALPLNLKSAIIGAIVSFSGLSVHFQVKSIIDGSSIRYRNFLLARIVQSIFCFFITLAICKILI